MSKVLVTGGAGFIGSHLVDSLIEEFDVVVLDDLSGGSKENIAAHMKKQNFQFIKGSITSLDDLKEALRDTSLVFHFAAQPDVRLSIERPFWDFEINVMGSMKLLEEARKHDVKKLLFASSGGTVYGETDVFPTPESIPFRPISNYGAAKGAVEMYLSSYSELYGIVCSSLRFANIIGARSTHGVIYDFFMKLKKDPSRLEVLGDGQQEKSYMHVSDAVDATLLVAEKITKGYLPINIGSGERLKVSRIAKLVIEALHLENASIDYTGTERGWAGDVVITDIDISLLKDLGWKPEVGLENGVRRYVQWLVDTYGFDA